MDDSIPPVIDDDEKPIGYVALVCDAVRNRVAEDQARRRQMDDSIPKKLRGFATLTPEHRRELSSMGGKAIPAEKRSFSLNRVLASAAGRKGGMAPKHKAMVRASHD